MARAIGFLLIVLSIVGCSKDDNPPKDLDIEFIEAYITDNSLTTTLTSEGVYRFVITENSSGNSSGDVFSIYYTLTDLRSGTELESHSASDGDPIKIQNNAGAIFPLGIEYGLDGIKEGETYGLILTGELAYKNYPNSSVAEDAILLFEVEVTLRETEADIAAQEDIEINDYITDNNLNDTMTNPVDAVEALNNGVYYKRTVSGNGAVPLSGDSITINYEGRFIDETVFDQLSNFKYQYNSGTLSDGLALGIAEMEQGEEATIFIPSNEGYGSSVVVFPGGAMDEMIEQSVIPVYASRVTPYKILIFDVTLQAIHNQ